MVTYGNQFCKPKPATISPSASPPTRYQLYNSFTFLLPQPDKSFPRSCEIAVMKSKALLSHLSQFCFTTRKRQILFGVSLGLGTLGLLGSVTRSHQNGFVAHEWGTFTSVQGSDGTLLSWRPLQTSR